MRGLHYLHTTVQTLNNWKPWDFRMWCNTETNVTWRHLAVNLTHMQMEFDLPQTHMQQQEAQRIIQELPCTGLLQLSDTRSTPLPDNTTGSVCQRLNSDHDTTLLPSGVNCDLRRSRERDTAHMRRVEGQRGSEPQNFQQPCWTDLKDPRSRKTPPCGAREELYCCKQ
jgi:hypothetical protein